MSSSLLTTGGFQKRHSTKPGADQSPWNPGRLIPEIGRPLQTGPIASPGEFPNGTGGAGRVEAPYLAAAAGQSKEIAAREGAAREEAKKKEAEERAKLTEHPASETQVDGPGEGNCEVNCTIYGEEEFEYEFDPRIDNCNMNVAIGYTSETDIVSFADEWQCRRWDKKQHRYINLSAEIEGYNVFGVAESEHFTVNGYQGVTFTEIFIAGDLLDRPFSEAGVCFKVRLHGQKAYDNLKCFEAPVPTGLSGPPDE